MNALILPFPIIRRRGFAEKQAVTAASFNERSGERYIARQIETQRDVMRRRGINEVIIDREMKSFEVAIRAELWRLILRYGDDGAA